MWFDAAKTRGNYVLWYFAPPGSKPLPFTSRFSSETWDTVHWWNDGAGEDDATNPTFYNGKAPFPFKGQGWCGDPDWFANGQPSDATPLARSTVPPVGAPICCFAGAEFNNDYNQSYFI